MNVPEIPQPDDPEFEDAVSALVASASVTRKMLIMIAAAGIDAKRLMLEHEELVLQAEAVIEAWCDHMGIEP